ncbi:MAG: FliM/FliN family flagellar motor switch protein [Phycisphaerales bacterium]
MPDRLKAILKLDVPVIVVLGSREMKLRDVTSLNPGAILELAKAADEELELLVNNKVIATGTAVKVGENFGIRISFVGDVRSRLAAMGPEGAEGDGAGAEEIAATGTAGAAASTAEQPVPEPAVAGG